MLPTMGMAKFAVSIPVENRKLLRTDTNEVASLQAT